jgi:hypothetical protein
MGFEIVSSDLICTRNARAYQVSMKLMGKGKWIEMLVNKKHSAWDR